MVDLMELMAQMGELHIVVERRSAKEGECCECRIENGC
jgi:hypothetical protein